ncbi:S1 family peptidase [Kordiimonas sp.]|uniref:S1 family peptidase n=1 Tax=Kordiimonas sp. TaxID=1970157 RepID=UPI003A8EC31C
MKHSFLTLSLTAVLAISTAQALHAQGVQQTHEQVSKALGYVVAKALMAEDTLSPGVPVESHATGFFIDRFGTMVTNHHLLEALGNYEPSTLTITVHMGDIYASEKRPAEVDFLDATKDLLVLRVRGSFGHKFNHVRPDFAYQTDITLAQTPVYTMGFPEGYSYMTGDGKINAFDGPSGHLYLWVTNMQFKSGQSGSPVYLEDGRIVGVVKGQERGFAQNNFIIPFRYVARIAGPGYFGPTEVVDKSTDDIIAAMKPEPARLKVYGHVPSPSVERRTVNRTFERANAPCTPSENLVWGVEAADGWMIDTSTIETRVVRKAAKALFSGLDAVSEKAFQLKAKLENAGDCVRDPSGRVIDEDVPASLDVGVTYTELREVMVPKQRLLYEAAYDGKAVALDVLPEGVTGVKATVSLGGNMEIALTPGDGNPDFGIIAKGNTLELSPESGWLNRLRQMHDRREAIG